MDINQTGTVTDLISSAKGVGPTKFEAIMASRAHAAEEKPAVTVPDYVRGMFNQQTGTYKQRKKADRQRRAMKQFMAGRTGINGNGFTDVLWLRVCESRMENRKRSKPNPTAPPRKHVRARSVRRGTRNLDGTKVRRQRFAMWRSLTVDDLKFKNAEGGVYEIEAPDGTYLNDVQKIGKKWHAIHRDSVGVEYKTRKAAAEFLLKTAQGV